MQLYEVAPNFESIVDSLKIQYGKTHIEEVIGKK